jgi:type II secretory pathway predicted ATPase ExeA
MNETLLPLFGLKFHPFRPEVPIDALHMTPAVEAFCSRVERTVGDGGFVMVTGEPGSGKSVTLRLLAERLRGLRDVVVGTVDHPQSRVSDFFIASSATSLACRSRRTTAGPDSRPCAPAGANTSRRL